MIKKVLALLAVGMLVLSVSAAWAIPTINIIEPLDETLPPTVDTLDFASSLIVGVLPEFANVTGVIGGATSSNFIAAGTYGIQMLEPAFEGGGVSDFAVIVISPRVPIANSQGFNLTFLSDGFAGTIPSLIPIIGGLSTFDAALLAFNAAVSAGLILESPAIVEDGTLQNLFTFTNASGLIVNAQSDVIPLPASLLLFGTGLLGIIPAWRLRRKA